MDDESRERSLGRLVLKALAIAGALTFLAIVMVNACATYAAPTKAGPVVNPVNPGPARPRNVDEPVPASESTPPNPDPALMAPTKAGPVFRPKPPAQVEPVQQQQAPGGW